MRTRREGVLARLATREGRLRVTGKRVAKFRQTCEDFEFIQTGARHPVLRSRRYQREGSPKGRIRKGQQLWGTEWRVLLQWTTGPPGRTYLYEKVRTDVRTGLSYSLSGVQGRQ